MLAYTNMLIALMFIGPSISIHLKEHGFQPDQIPLIISLTALCFGIISPFMHKLTKCVPKRGVLLFGQILVTLALLMICNSTMIYGFKDSKEVMLIGLMFLGFSGGLNMIPALPEMMDTIEFDDDFCSYYEKKDIETVISSVFVTFHSIGEAVGPLSNSIMMSYFGYRRAHEILAVWILIYAMLYFVVCGNFKMFVRRWDPYRIES